MLLSLQQQREVKMEAGKEQRKTVNLKIKEGDLVSTLRCTEEQLEWDREREVWSPAGHATLHPSAWYLPTGSPCPWGVLLVPWGSCVAMAWPEEN